MYKSNSFASGAIPATLRNKTLSHSIIILQNVVLAPSLGLPSLRLTMDIFDEAAGYNSSLTQLTLRGMGLGGTLPTTVVNNSLSVGFGPSASDLQALALGSNVIEGTIPSLALMSNLQFLDLSTNGLTGGVDGLGGLINARDIDLAFNRLSPSTESLLATIRPMLHLERVDLRGNPSLHLYAPQLPDTSPLGVSAVARIGIPPAVFCGQCSDSDILLFGGCRPHMSCVNSAAFRILEARLSCYARDRLYDLTDETRQVFFDPAVVVRNVIPYGNISAGAEGSTPTPASLVKFEVAPYNMTRAEYAPPGINNVELLSDLFSFTGARNGTRAVNGSQQLSTCGLASDNSSYFVWMDTASSGELSPEEQLLKTILPTQPLSDADSILVEDLAMDISVSVPLCPPGVEGAYCQLPCPAGWQSWNLNASLKTLKQLRNAMDAAVDPLDLTDDQVAFLLDQLPSCLPPLSCGSLNCTDAIDDAMRLCRAVGAGAMVAGAYASDLLTTCTVAIETAKATCTGIIAQKNNNQAGISAQNCMKVLLNQVEKVPFAVNTTLNSTEATSPGEVCTAIRQTPASAEGDAGSSTDGNSSAPMELDDSWCELNCGLDYCPQKLCSCRSAAGPSGQFVSCSPGTSDTQYISKACVKLNCSSLVGSCLAPKGLTNFQCGLLQVECPLLAACITSNGCIVDGIPTDGGVQRRLSLASDRPTRASDDDLLEFTLAARFDSLTLDSNVRIPPSFGTTLSQPRLPGTFVESTRLALGVSVGPPAAEFSSGVQHVNPLLPTWCIGRQQVLVQELEAQARKLGLSPLELRLVRVESLEPSLLRLVHTVNRLSSDDEEHARLCHQVLEGLASVDSYSTSDYQSALIRGPASLHAWLFSLAHPSLPPPSKKHTFGLRDVLVILVPVVLLALSCGATALKGSSTSVQYLASGIDATVDVNKLDRSPKPDQSNEPVPFAGFEDALTTATI
jgi:hypothetical protein